MTSAVSREGLETLLVRVREAKGPDRELDWRLAEHFNIPEPWRDTAAWPPFMKGSKFEKSIPIFTASVDAALALVGRVLPGWSHRSGTLLDGRFEAVVQKPDTYDWHGAYGANQPLAIIAAVLTALLEAPSRSPSQ